MESYENKVACIVCRGKGGFKKPKMDFMDDNWNDCLYCSGYGFTDNHLAEDELRKSLKFSSYRNKIENELCLVGDVTEIYSDTIGKDLVVHIKPIEKKAWVELIKVMLRFSYHSNVLTITPKQIFFYDNTDDPHYKYYWEIHIYMKNLSDLDGLIDMLDMFTDTM